MIYTSMPNFISMFPMTCEMAAGYLLTLIWTLIPRSMKRLEFWLTEENHHRNWTELKKKFRWNLELVILLLTTICEFQHFN